MLCSNRRCHFIYFTDSEIHLESHLIFIQLGAISTAVINIPPDTNSLRKQQTGIFIILKNSIKNRMTQKKREICMHFNLPPINLLNCTQACILMHADTYKAHHIGSHRAASYPHIPHPEGVERSLALLNH